MSSLTIKHNIVEDATAIIEGKLNSDAMKTKVIQPSLEAVKNRILKNTDSATDITSQPFENLSPEYRRKKKRSSKADLRNEELTLETMYGSSKDTETGILAFEKSSEHLYYNQKGAPNRGRGGRLPQRKIFPEPGDENVGQMKEVVAELTKILETYMNSDGS